MGKPVGHINYALMSAFIFCSAAADLATDNVSKGHRSSTITSRA